MVRTMAFAGGLLLGLAAALAGIHALQDAGLPQPAVLQSWLSANLGTARWLFLATLMLYGFGLLRLTQELEGPRRAQVVSSLDQLTELTVHVFVGIGVVWTAIGMRDALQAALANPDAALSDSAGDVLQALVDGGILLALSTTIVGGLGGYIMKVGKTLLTGRALHAFYDAENHRDIGRLIDVVERIEKRLAATEVSTRTSAGNAEGMPS